MLGRCGRGSEKPGLLSTSVYLVFGGKLHGGGGGGGKECVK